MCFVNINFVKMVYLLKACNAYSPVLLLIFFSSRLYFHLFFSVTIRDLPPLNMKFSAHVIRKPYLPFLQINFANEKLGVDSQDLNARILNKKKIPVVALCFTPISVFKLLAIKMVIEF